MLKTIIKISFIIVAILLSSCIEDIVDSNEVRFSNSSDLITYTETRTTFLNGEDIPQLVTVDELNQSLGDYYIIDIRDEFDFQSGHILGAKNVQMKNVLNHLKEQSLSVYQKIIIISNTGQLASYVSCLLIIAGYENTYTLNGGMTYWNQVFADELKNAIDRAMKFARWQRVSRPSDNMNPPDLYYESNPKTIEAKIEERIQILLNEPKENIFISAKQLDMLYSIRQRRYVGKFVVYVHTNELLFANKANAKGWIFGPIATKFYDTPNDFTTNKALLTLPTNLELVLYSDVGQRSAFITAYLKMLGYSVKTIKYGKLKIAPFVVTPIYSRSRFDPPGMVIGYDTTFYLIDFEQVMRDYPYEVGE